MFCEGFSIPAARSEVKVSSMSNPNVPSNVFTPEEFGRPGPDAKPVDPQGQPRGEARMPIPHMSSFMGMTNWINRSYFANFDEALQHSRENAERMRSMDAVIDGCMKLLTYPISLLSSHLEPDDSEDEFQIQCASDAEANLCTMQNFLFIKRWLLDNGAFVGRSGCQVRWQWVTKRGKKVHMPTGFVPVHGDKIIFKWDGRVGILVAGQFPLPTEPSERGRVYYLTPEEREQFICHEVEPEDVSFYKPLSAGQIHGVGLRSKLYWLWALKQRVWAMGMDFLQWFSKGLTVFPFPGGNNDYATELRKWIEGQDGSTAWMLPVFNNVGVQPYDPVMRFDAGTSSPAFIQKLLTEYFDDLIKFVILGQTLTSGTAATGLGSGVAAAHQTTFDIKVKYHATALQETLSRDLVGPYYRANYPGVAPARWVFEIDDPNTQSMLENAQLLYQMGAALPEESLLDAAGIPEVKPDDTILTDIQGQQPAAMGGLPAGVPVEEGQPMQLSLRQFTSLCRMAENGNRRAQRVLLSRRFGVRGLTVR